MILRFSKIIFAIFVLISLFAKAQENTNIPPEIQMQVHELSDLLTKYQSEGNLNQQASVINKIAFLYWESEIYTEAINYFNQSVEINKNIGNKNALYNIYTNLGMIYSDIDKKNDALKYFNLSVEIARSSKNSVDLASSLINLSLNLFESEKFQQSIDILDEAVIIAKELNNIKMLKTSYGRLSECYEKLGNAEKSLEYFNLYSSFEKHIQKKAQEEITKETKKKITAMQEITNQAVNEKNQSEKRLEDSTASLKQVRKINREKQMELELKEAVLNQREAELKNRNNLIKASLVVIFLIFLIAIITYRNYKQKKAANELLARQNREIKTKNKNIERSINYAQRIQEAMLPDINGLKEFVPESFILFKPRDVVSGDFYWFIDPYEVHLNLERQTNDNGSVSDKIKKLKDNNYIIAAVDCTGHGVPGAFMSMIGMNLLYEIVSHGIVDADVILNELHVGIRHALRQDVIDNQDGMDMAICVVKKKDKVVEFAGAKNPLVYIKGDKMHKIKGDRYAVGGHQYEKERIYTKHTVKIDEPTSFYIFSDGYKDQFGGADHTKFLSGNFRDILLKIHKEEFMKQKEILNRTITEWKRDYKQTDDILVVGFKCS